MLSFFHNLTLLIKEDTVFELGSNDKLESGVYVFYKIYDNDFNGHTGFLYVDGTDLKLEETNLVPEMIENTLYMAYSNDVAMQVNGRIIVLIEHQSTINNNLQMLGSKDGLVYGQLKFRRYPNDTCKAFQNTYDFDMQSGIKSIPRNIATIFGSLYAGKGTPYKITIYGEYKLQKGWWVK